MDYEENDESNKKVQRVQRSTTSSTISKLRARSKVAPMPINRAKSLGSSTPRRKSSTIAARRLIRKLPIANKYRQLVRRSSRVTKSSKQIEAEEKEAVEEAARLENEYQAQLKALHEPELIRSSTYIYEDILYQIGDIIRVYGQHDLNIYYAKIIGFWKNQFCEKSVSIRWLVPIYQMTHPIWQTVKKFEPSLFREASLNEKLIPMETIQFVKRLPPILDLGEEEPFLLYHNNNIINLDTPQTTLTSI